MNSPADEIRALAARALDDARAENDAAREAVVRAQAYMDKAMELSALADRIDTTTIDGGDRELQVSIVRPA
jgi:hypothetical protein